MSNWILPGALLLAAPGALAQEGALEKAYLSARATIAAGPAAWGAGAPPVGPAGGVTPGGSTVDHSDQFPGPSRSQGSVGSCHAFAAVGLIEAAYFRRFGEHARFSEADLFMRRNLLSGDAYSEYRRTGRARLEEGHFTPSDIEFALRNGLATTPQYDAFQQRYLRYREAERRTLQDIERQRRRDPWYVRLFYNARRHWVRLQQDPRSQRILQRYLAGNDDTLEAQREQARRRFAGFRMTRSEFSAADPAAVGAEECRRRGRPQTEAVTAELLAGRPVAVSYAQHALIIKGMRPGSDGATFQTRNSHGPGGDIQFQESQMCQIYQMMSVVER